jgi:hypothetical protein
MKRWRTLLFLVTAIFAFNSCDSTTGGGTEAEGLSGQLVDSHGTPIANASVTVYNTDSTGPLAKAAVYAATNPTQNYSDSTTTDNAGRYHFASLKSGRYNLLGTSQKNGDTQTVFIPSILLEAGIDLGADTLRVPGSILIQAQSNSGTLLGGVECYIPGSSLIAISDDMGRCLISGIPPGIFQVRLAFTGLQTDTSANLQVQSGVTTNAGLFTLVADPALAPPEATGLSASYDSISGIVTLTWSPVKVSDLAGYQIYRRQNLSEIPELISLSLVTDTVFKDTLRRGNGDGSRVLYLYQIKAQDKDGNLSALYSDPVGITAVPPPSQGQYFSLNTSTVALWTFNSHTNGSFTDASPNAFNLSGANNFGLTSSPYDSAAVFSGTAPVVSSYVSHGYANALTMGGSGQITYEARIYLSQYEAQGHGWVLGTYDGVIMLVGPNGELVAGGQKVRNGAGYWIQEISTKGVVPLNRWVNIAVAFDQASGQAYGYIDGSPIQLYNENYTTNPITDPFRVSTGSFFVGDDGSDNYQFSGTIDEIRVSNNLILGTGLPVIVGTPATAPSNLSYSTNPAQYTVNSSITQNVPTVSGTPVSYSVTPTLPTGLNLNSSTGVISGTPTVLTAAENYTVTASNSLGSTTAIVNISVVAAGLIDTTTHFSINASTVALWTFNSHKGGTFTDLSPNGFNLSGANNFGLTSSPYDSAAVFTGSAQVANSYASYAYANALTMGGTGKITYEVRMYLSQNEPPADGWVLGTYDGVIMLVTPTGQLLAGGQKVRNGAGYWIQYISSAGAVPLNRWVDVALAFDQTTGQVYGYIDGNPIQLYDGNYTPYPITNPWRVSTGSFLVGDDGPDNYQFRGNIDEIRVSNNLILGPGPAVLSGNPP